MIKKLKNIIKQIFYRFKFRHVYFGSNVHVNLNNFFGGFNRIGDNCIISSSEIGYATYIADSSIISNAKIGKFCAIGKNTQICLGKHPTNYVSIHPSFYSTKKQAGFSFVKNQIYEEHDYIDESKKFVVSIGNDVWIGNNVIIMDGVEIGSGAVIGSGSIVTRDIEPYGIAYGQPAKLKKLRFSKAVVEKLIEIKWWDFKHEKIKNSIDKFYSVEDFIKFYEDK